jgi:ribosomal protein S18 acetylase RimI-like enzyme
MTSAVIIRPATVEDIPQIQTVARAARQVAYVDTNLVSVEWNKRALRSAWSAETLSMSITQSVNYAIVALVDDVIAGYLCGVYKSLLADGHVRLYRVYLHPDYWNKRIGYRLWQNYRKAIEANTTHIDVGIEVGNARALRFFERLGFQQINADDGLIELQMTVS